MAELIAAHPVFSASPSLLPGQRLIRPRIVFFTACGSRYSLRRDVPGLSMLARPGNSCRRSCACALSKGGEPTLPAGGSAESASAVAPETVAKKSGAKLHDFCLGIPYGSALVLIGIGGLATAASRVNLGILALAGVLILGLSTQSLKVWKKGQSSLLHIATEAGVAGAVLGRELYISSQTTALTVFPSAIVVGLSAVMFLFYAYVYLAGGNPPSKRKPA